MDLDGGLAPCNEEDGNPSRKKLRLSKDQSAVLEESYKEHNTFNPQPNRTYAGVRRTECSWLIFDSGLDLS
ncbi:Homeobox-leucine zipper protein HAT4 [Linum perenne]